MRLSRSLCKAVGDTLANTASHSALENLFITAGAPGNPGTHSVRWKNWLYIAGQDPETDSLAVLGSVIEEFMDSPPSENSDKYSEWQDKKANLEAVLHDNGLRYYRFGRVLPLRSNPPH